MGIDPPRLICYHPNKRKDEAASLEEISLNNMYPQIEDPIPIGMLLAEVTFFPDDSAELFGFWYYKETTLPQTRQEKKLFPVDLAMGRCCRLRLIGSSQQIEDILLSAEWNPGVNESWPPTIQKVIEKGKKHRFTSFGFDNLFRPKGILIAMNLPVRVTEDRNSVIQRLHSGEDEVTLEITHDWDLGKEVRNYLKKTDN
jgi:hypothetical protein